MGIRFLCPQGHKLNVKSFLAGKTGFCPHCKARVEIPLTSTRSSSKQAAAEEEVIPLAQPVAEPPAEVAVARGVALPELTDLPARPIAENPTSPAFLQPPNAERALRSVELLPSSRPSADAREQWWVLSKNGQQYGPATQEIIRQWIDEGRVVAETLIRREDHPDWQRAEDNFRELFTSHGPN